MKNAIQNLFDFTKTQKVSFLAFSLIYFAIRVTYWITVDETPFSDIADYVRIGQQVADHWDFAHTRPFWLSYKPPTMPLFLAAYFKLRNSFNLDFWPLFQTIFHFCSLLFLLIQLQKLKDGFLISCTCFFVFALSKSSVFWSLKPSTEYLSESFLLFLCAFTIYTENQKKILYFFILGVATMAAILLRPQFIPTLLVISVFPIFLSIKKPEKIKMIFAFLLGGFLTWAPWGVRTYRIYQHPIFTSTQGPYSFLWELGTIRYIDATGEIKNTDVTQLQEDADKAFRNDYESMQYAKKMSMDWLKNNLVAYLNLIPFRIWNSISDTSEALTQVSRNNLLPKWANWVFIDKSSFLVVTGIIGLVLASLLNPQMWPICLLPISQWLMGVAFLSYPRIIDPALPFIYFGNFVFLILIRNFARRKRRQSPCHK